MTLTTALDRRRLARERLCHARRRYPRLRVRLDAFYEGGPCAMFFDDVDLSLRGAFLRCRMGDSEGTEGVLRLALPGVEMLKAKVVVLRRSEVGRPGMALRFVELSDADRRKLAAFLLRTGGLAQIPQLDAKFQGWAWLRHPLVRRDARRASRA